MRAKVTPAQSASLTYFKASEFKHPELVSYAFAVFLDDVRRAYGYPIQITNDARTAAENQALLPHGASLTSRHLYGEAVDIRFPPTSQHLWKLVSAVFKVAGDRAIELELVNSRLDQHVHIAFLPLGVTSKLLVKAD